MIRVRALAKINLDLRVLGKRPDGFHELRTIFQTISLADVLEIEFTKARRTEITLEDALQIENNLVMRAAQAVMDTMRITGRIAMRLVKRVPMGAGLGGGSSDAAAVLLALPTIARRRIEPAKLAAIAAELGSDVPFFLLGGTAVGIGRGTEVFPLPDAPSMSGVLVAPGVHVNTAQAYRDLSPRLTTDLQQNKMVSFQSVTWDTGDLSPARNDFEEVVFEQHPELAALKNRLGRAGAAVSLMSGSGSSVYGLFPNRDQIARGLKAAGQAKAFRISLVSRVRYRTMWWRALAGQVQPGIWPPQSRYSR
jgi:4-diphosphocytidyl-2-C-methyl-D-erythritol kinase